MSQLVQQRSDRWTGTTVVRASLFAGGLVGGLQALGGLAGLALGFPSSLVLLFFVPAILARPFYSAAIGSLASEGRIGLTTVVTGAPLAGRLGYLLLAQFTTHDANPALLALSESLVIVLVAGTLFRSARFPRGPSQLVELIREARSLVFASGGSVLQQRADGVTLEPLAGPAVAGTYFAAARLLDVGSQAFGAALLVFVGDAAREGRQKPEGFEEVFRSYWRPLRRLLVAPVLVVGIALPGVAPFLFGSGYEIEPLVAGILAVGVVFEVSTGPVGLVLISAGKSRSVMRVNLLTGVLSLLLNIALIPVFGALGAAAAMAASILTNNVLLHYLSRRAGLHLIGRNDLRPVIGILLAAMGALGVASGGVSVLVAGPLAVAALGVGEMSRRNRHA